MSKALQTRMVVHMEGLDEPLLVLVDQRDYAAWEVQPENEGEGSKYTVMQRFLAWSAAKRHGQLSIGWREFNERLCIQALIDLPEEEQPEGEDEQSLDPGRTAARGD